MADRGDDVRDPELADRVEGIADSMEHGYNDYAVSVLRKVARRLRCGEGEPTYVHRDDGWIIEEYENVHLASCPDCAFSFDAGHIDTLAREKGEDTYTCPACAEEAGGEGEGRHRDPVAEWDELPSAASQLDEDDFDGMSDHDLGAMLKLASDLADDLIGREAAERLMNADRLRGAPEGAGGGEVRGALKRISEEVIRLINAGKPERAHTLHEAYAYQVLDKRRLRTGREERDDG